MLEIVFFCIVIGLQRDWRSDDTRFSLICATVKNLALCTDCQAIKLPSLPQRMKIVIDHLWTTFRADSQIVAYDTLCTPNTMLNPLSFWCMWDLISIFIRDPEPKNFLKLRLQLYSCLISYGSSSRYALAILLSSLRF